MRAQKRLFSLAEKQWLTDPLPWFSYHKARNETSHTYNEEKAEAVYQVALEFAHSAERLLNRLEQANANQR